MIIELSKDGFNKLEVYTKMLYELDGDSYKVTGWLTAKVFVNGEWKRFDAEVSFIDKDLNNAISYVTYYLYRQLLENEDKYMEWETEVIN